MTKHLERAIFEIRTLAKIADVRLPMRVSISFGDCRDASYFMAEVMRQLEPELYPAQSQFPNEFQIAGVNVRIV